MAQRRTGPAQGYVTSYAPRLRQYANALISPVLPAQPAPAARTTKRGTVAINYAENEYDDDIDFDDNDGGGGGGAGGAGGGGGGGGTGGVDGFGSRRPTGLRSLRRDELHPERGPAGEKLGTEARAPMNVQPNFRDWVVKKVLKPGKAIQKHTQANLPLTLVPIRIDIEVPAHQPLEPFYLPRNYLELGLSPSLPAYRKPDAAPPYRLKDAFLWNLHEALITPEEFAITMVRDLDFPNPHGLASSVSNQIRQQLEEYAGVALHPLFQSVPATQNAVAAATDSAQADEDVNHDDAYRCIVNLNVNLHNRLYTDKFEWSLLHSQRAAETFARVTCADLGLGTEWVSAIAHGISEAVLKLKKEVCERGGLVSMGINGAPGAVGAAGSGDIDNMAANGAEAGWRYDPDGLADEWEPKLEILSKEEIERREGDRERQIRRLRRETARFSSTAAMPDGSGGGGGRGSSMSMSMSMPMAGPSMFDTPDGGVGGGGGAGNGVGAGELGGRGERSKKKRRFRSLSPFNRGATPGARGTPDAAGYGGGGGTLNEWERQTWRCSNCLVWGTAVWATRDGPAGPRTLCHNCGMLHERDKRLPVWQKGLHRLDMPLGR